MIPGGLPSETTTKAVRDLTTHIVTGYLVMASVVTGSLMAFREDVFGHPRFAHLNMILHGHLETFGAVLAIAGVIHGIAALFGDGVTHLTAIRVRIIVTLICGLCWSTNAYAQITYVKYTGDWPGVAGMVLISLFYILYSAGRYIYYREVRSRGH
jgi:hypothetical protein